MVYVNWISVIVIVAFKVIYYVYAKLKMKENSKQAAGKYHVAAWIQSHININKKTYNMISKLAVGNNVKEAVIAYYCNIINRVCVTVVITNLFCIINVENATLIMFLGAIAAIAIVALRDNELNKKMAQRNNQMLIDYSVIANKLALLLNAGLNVRNAWEKICLDYELKLDAGDGMRYAYEEMKYTHNEILNGQMEIRAYAAFGKRTGIAQYNKFGSLLSQSIVRGNEYIVNTLENEAERVLSERKDVIKQNGEKLGTKLMIPMMGFLVITLLLVMIPAFTNI